MASSQDQIIGAIGDWGPWQRKYVCLLGSLTLFGAWPSLIITFMSPPTDFWCADLSGVSSEVPHDVIRNATLNQCHAWTPPDNNNNTSKKTCTSFNHDRSTFANTIVQEWDLVCDREHFKNLAQSSYFAGMMVGILPIGFLSDRFGRKTILVPILLGTVFIGSLLPFSPNIEAFIALRFLQGAVKIGVFTLVFVWTMEVVGGDWKTYAGMGLEFPWVASWLLISLMGFCMPDWRYLQWMTSLPGVLCLALFYVLPESPKWLLASGRLGEAERLMRQAAVVNGRPLPEAWRLEPLPKQEVQRQGNLLDLFRSANLAIKTLVLYVNWFANSFVYYGITLNSGNLGGSYRINFLVNGLLEIPAYALSMYVIHKGGRRRPYVAFLVVGGLVLLSTTLVAKGEFRQNWPVLAMAMLGKFCLTGSFAILYVYSAEIYPTVVRSIGVGSSSVFARIGGMVAPFVGSLDRVVNPTFPIAIFGLVSLVAGCLVLLLPETRDLKLPDTLREAEEAVKVKANVEMEEDSEEAKQKIISMDI